MSFFRKNISEEQFVDFLLQVRSKIEDEVIKFFKNDLEYTGDEKLLKYEARIFSLWLVTLSAPPNNENIKDLLHDKFCEYLGLDENTENIFFEDIDKRYSNYFDAFNMWRKNPQSGHMIGSVMIEIIKNQNSNFSLKKELPNTGADECLHAFILFGELFKSIMQSIAELKEKYKIDNIEKK